MNTADQQPGAWGASGVLTGLGAAILAVIVGVGMVSIFDPELETTGGKIAGQSIVEIAVILVAVWFAKAATLAGRLRALGLRRFARGALKTAALAYLAYFAFAIVYSSIFAPQQEDIARDLGGGESVIATVLAGLMIVVLAPVGEEIFVRGFMFGGIRATLGFWPGAILSGAFFGMLHYTGPESWEVVGQLAVFGGILAWLYHRTGSLWLPIIVHAINNSLAYTILLLDIETSARESAALVPLLLF